MNNFLFLLQPKALIDGGYCTYLSAILTVAIMPVHVQYLPPFMILWCLSMIVENYSKFHLVLTIEKKIRVLFILFILYYMWQIVGLIYSADIRMGLLNLFGRLSLLLFPLVLIFPGEQIRKNSKKLLKIFAFSTSIYLLFCFINALFRSVNLQDGILAFNPHPKESPWLSYFFSSDLTASQHPSYIAMYVLMSTFICLESWFDVSISVRKRIWWLILGLSLIATQYFLSSRSGILNSFILVPVYFIFKLRRTGRNKFSWLLILTAVLILLPLIVKNQRVDNLYSKIRNSQNATERIDDPRFKIWYSSLKLASDNLLLGVGIGDARTSLALEYKKQGEENMANERFNAHNQFLEVIIEGGVIGLILFISVYIYMFYIGFSDKNLLYIIFLLMTLLFFQFETMLYRLAGVSFFALFSFLLVQNKVNQIAANKKPSDQS
jgi:O-antigen ligase